MLTADRRRLRCRRSAAMSAARCCLLAVLELEANGQPQLPPLSHTNTLLTTLLASFNRLEIAAPHLARHGATLKKLAPRLNHGP